MKLITSNRFDRLFKKLPREIQKRTRKKLKILLKDISYPSLGVKKVKKYEGVLEGRVTRDYRFLFSVTSDAYFLLNICRHDEILD